MTEFDYEALWQEEAKAKAAQKEAEWRKEHYKEAEEFKAHLRDPAWVKAENARRTLKNAEYAERYHHKPNVNKPLMAILDLPWKDYKFLTLQEISEMTGISRQKVRALLNILLDKGYLKPVKSGYRKIRKAYQPI